MAELRHSIERVLLHALLKFYAWAPAPGLNYKDGQLVTWFYCPAKGVIRLEGLCFVPNPLGGGIRSRALLSDADRSCNLRLGVAGILLGRKCVGRWRTGRRFSLFGTGDCLVGLLIRL